jgi:hypothetical protein
VLLKKLACAGKMQRCRNCVHSIMLEGFASSVALIVDSIIPFIAAVLKMLLKAYMQRFTTTGIHRPMCRQPQG